MVKIQMLESAQSLTYVLDYSEERVQIEHGSAQQHAETLKSKTGADAVIVVRHDQFWVF